MATQITTNEFQEKVLNSSVPVLVDFFATWCGPCKMMAPVLDELGQELAGSAEVYKVDVDQEVRPARPGKRPRPCRPVRWGLQGVCPRGSA